MLTGKRRNCKVGECDKYEKSETKRLPKKMAEGVENVG
jgi:hypothetical protein